MKISRENLNFVSSISGNTYILAFSHIVVTIIPGNFRKGGLGFRENSKFWRTLENLEVADILGHLVNFLDFMKFRKGIFLLKSEVKTHIFEGPYGGRCN